MNLVASDFSVSRKPPNTSCARIQGGRQTRRSDQRMCTPEMLRAITRRWISEVPSKIV